MPPASDEDSEYDFEVDDEDNFGVAPEEFAYQDNTDDDPDFSDPDADEKSDIENGGDIEDDNDLFGGEGDPNLMDEADAVDGNEMEEFHNDLKAAHGFKNGLKHRRKDGRIGGRRARGEEVLSPEVRSLLGEANQAFVHEQYDSALSILKRVIQIEPGAYVAWKTLGEVFIKKGDVHRGLLAWLTAAHAMPRDWELWVLCAKMSLEQYGKNKQNYRDQAVYCYSRAIRAAPDNIDLIYDRSMLLKEIGSFNKAADGLNVLNRLVPYNPGVLRELATLYMETKRVPEAIALYDAAVKHYKKTGNKKMTFDWSALNIFVELYMIDKRWNDAIAAIKNHGRWLAGRSADNFWEKWDDDREWDAGPERRSYEPKYRSGLHVIESYTLPIELRIKLGVCRLRLGHEEEALHHFAFLRNVGSQEYADLYQEVADVLSEAGKYEDAIQYYTAVTDDAAYLDDKLWMSTARCYRNIGKLEEAEDTFNMIIEAYPQNEDAMLQLAEIFEVSDRKDEALDLVNEVIRIRREKEATVGMSNIDPALRGDGGPSDGVTEPDMSLLPNQAPPGPRKRRVKVAPSVEERVALDAKRTEQTSVKFRQLEILNERMHEGDSTAVKDWLDTAGELVDDFRNTKALYPSERSHMFTGFVPIAQRRAAAQGAKVRLEKMQHRLQESLMYQEEEIDKPEELVTFRGLNFDQWLWIFCQYAIGLTKYEGNYSDAYLVCSGAKESTVFYHDKNKTFTIYTTWLACAIHAGDSESCSTLSRWFMSTFQFQNESYSLFTAACTVSRNGIEVFHNNANQKFLLRQIKTMDSILTGIKRTGAAALTGVDEHGKEFKPTEIDTSLLMLYGHILACGKSYVSALNYYSRVYAVAPENPMVLFCIGLSYLHRSQQRQSENRHMQALQGMTFLFEYFDRRTEVPDAPEEVKMERKQECEFNLARAFHHLGLMHLAIPYYERVLKISEEWGERISGDLKWEAAYNLQMIYVTSGNTILAKDITERHLVI